MRLAKPHLDLGLFTEDLASHRRFWGEAIGLRLDHQIPFDDNWTQHRFDAHDSVVKVNHWARKPLPVRPPTGYVGLTIAWEGATGELRNPGGEWVRRVAPGTDRVTRIGITVRSPDPERLMRFYVDAMEFERRDAFTACCGDSLLFVEEGPGGSETEDFIGPGFRYLTVQIFDADRACEEVVARGGRLARSPIDFRGIARFGFVKDPDGNWIEMSARASLTGRPVGGA
ncbi:MAG TPA: VOC family protein [Nevskiaceae bacterium]|nr:VOC family protein [Nevskiaceae bacterium]